jgi:hypothetical protein
MNTFILKWNPAISSVTMDAYKRLCRNYPFVDLNWSVWDYEHAKQDDRFYLLRVGDGITGIVMNGHFSSQPQLGEDWSGKGRATYYCDLEIDYAINPETTPILTTKQLEQAIPDFDWRGGHSGLMLTEEQASKLHTLFAEYLKTIPEIVQDFDVRRTLIV